MTECVVTDWDGNAVTRRAVTFTGRTLKRGMIVGIYCDALTWVDDIWEGRFEQNLYYVDRDTPGGTDTSMTDIRDLDADPRPALVKGEPHMHAPLTLGSHGRLREARVGEFVVGAVALRGTSKDGLSVVRFSGAWIQRESGQKELAI